MHVRPHGFGSQQLAPAKAAGFWRLDRGDSQAVQASSAFLLRTVEKCFSPRLARERCDRRSKLALAHHAVQERERKTGDAFVKYLRSL
jgi:hypothetical protein